MKIRAGSFIVACCVFFFPLSVIADGRANTDAQDPSGHRRVQTVLERYGIDLKKTALRNRGEMKVYFVDLPYDPSSSGNARYYHKLFLEVLDANGGKDYALDDEMDGLVITVRWKSESNSMSIDYEEAIK